MNVRHCGDPFAIYMNTESWFCTAIVNIMLYVNCISVRHFFK